MKLILKIAWRNILRHKGKSFVIGIILLIGSLIMTVELGIINGMNRGLEQNIVNGFMGDLVLASDKEKSDNILFKMMGESIETITNYKAIEDALKKEDYIESFLPIGKNTTMVLNEEGGEMSFQMVIGTDLDRYTKFFPGSFTPVDGKLWHGRQAGVLLPVKAREEHYQTMNIWYKSENTPLDEKNLTADARENKDVLVTKESIVFMGMGNDDISSSDIRVPVKSVIRYKALNTFWGHFAIMDIDSYRQCLGYIETDATAELSKDKKKLMAMEGSDLDSMFGAGNLIVGDKGNADISNVSFRKKDTDNAALKTDPDTGTYNLVLVKLKPGVSLNSGYKKLGRTLRKHNLGVHPITWENASGMIGTMASIIQTAMLTFAVILFLVAIIIIVNTLSMAAIERTTEIGMMRAVGAQKGFIAKMFISETAILAAVFGGLGIIAGSFIVKAIPAMRLTSDNDMVQLIYGGDTFLPAIGTGSIFLLILALFVVTTIAAAYPVKVARSITPLDAISRD